MTGGHRAAARGGGDGRRRAVLAVAGAGGLFGTTGTIAAVGPDDLSPLAAGAWRSVIGAVVLWIVARRVTPARSALLLRRPVAWLGGIGVAGYQLTFFEAVGRTGVALGTTITIGTGPVAAGILDATLRRRVPSSGWFGGTAIAVVGAALLSTGAARVDAVGIALAACAGCAFPLYGEVAQRLMQDTSFVPATTSVFVTGAILLSPLAAVTAPQAMATVDAAATVVTLGVATLAGAYLLWGAGLSSLSLSVVVAVTLVEPAVATALAIVVVREPVTARLVGGIVMTAAGVWVIAHSALHTDARADAQVRSHDRTVSPTATT